MGAGGTISGNGSLGSLIVESGGILNPGNSPGTLTVASLTLAGTTNIELAGDTEFDQVEILNTSALTFGGNLIFDFTGTLGGGPELDLSIFVLDGATSGTFAAVSSVGKGYEANWTYSAGTESWSAMLYDTNYTFSESTGALNVAPIPEPTTWAIFTLGVVVVAVSCRYRRA